MYDLLISIVSLLGFPPIDDDASLFYNFLLAFATFLFFLITCISVLIAAISMYYMRRSSEIALNSLEVALTGQINYQIKNFEEKKDMAEKKLSHVLQNRDILLEYNDNIFEHEDKNGKRLVHFQFSPWSACKVLKRWYEDNRNMYFHDLETGENPLRDASSLLFFHERYYEQEGYCSNDEAVAETIYKAEKITESEIKKIEAEITAYNSYIETLNAGLKKL